MKTCIRCRKQFLSDFKKCELCLIKHRERCKKYRLRNSYKIKEYAKKYQLENKDRLALKRRGRYQNNKVACNKASREWYLNNKERRLHLTRVWRISNPEKYAESLRRRKQRLESAPGGPFNHARLDYQERIKFFGGKCAYCPGPYETLDHTLPLCKKGGTNFASNIKPTCKKCNGSKGQKTLSEWLKQKTL